MLTLQRLEEMVRLYGKTLLISYREEDALWEVECGQFEHSNWIPENHGLGASIDEAVLECSRGLIR